jgi:adenine-specific DNA glycosylase
MMSKQTMAKQLQTFYLDWVNNYLTVDKIAEHNEITVKDAELFIELGRSYHEEGLNNV